MNETEMSSLNPAQLRLREARYFFEQFLASSGPPRDSYFHMVCNFDAFLFALASVEEMTDDKIRDVLRGNEAFRFIKALRNLTTHHSVLAATPSVSKFNRPFARHIDEHIGADPQGSARLSIKFDEFRKIFDTIESMRPSEKSSLDSARGYLEALESRAKPSFFEEVMLEALVIVERNVA